MHRKSKFFRLRGEWPGALTALAFILGELGVILLVATS